MCGITGYIKVSEDCVFLSSLLRSSKLLKHRGPDDYGEWRDSAGIVGLQHYRLSIQDLTSAGAQPMLSANGRYVIVFNGEIYNHLELRNRLESENNFSFRGNSDTETFLECISTWGIGYALEMSVGMFAFGIYDKLNTTLILGRDRLGEKPLYYGYIDGNFYFSSELKVFKSRLGREDVDLRAVSTYLRYGYITGANSIYKNIYRLNPGSTLTISVKDVRNKLNISPNIYWNPLRLGYLQDGSTGSEDYSDVVSGLDSVLTRAVSSQLLSDVPVGALLSGGVDSSIIVSLMQKESIKPITTFSIGFEDSHFDEAPYASKVARYLGTDHNELYVSQNQVLDLVPKLADVYCEPFGDSSQLPTLLLMELTSRKVKVALSGDGGDELFGGYDRYYRVANGWSILNRIPPILRKNISRALKCLPHWALAEIVKNVPHRLRGICNSPDRILKICDILPSRTIEDFNLQMISSWNPAFILPEYEEYDTIYSSELPHANTIIERLMLADIIGYLPDDLMVKVDRSAMSFGVECRSPFLDHRIVEYAWRTSLTNKTSLSRPKSVLKDLLVQYLPSELYDRPKQGFGMPIDTWLRGALSEWAKSLINDNVNDLPFLNLNIANKLLDEHLTNKRNWGHKLWPLLMLLAWFQSLK